ncbi:MAG: TetR/AcrR family transcriptional regulator [Tractidigestivibacter sp.]|uniref:TetR/AcrR family transcriptional regulator n=1 Tax=Tractidigestivibacter sp. TaxID=2847320 RepID=UPI003D8D4889
MKRPASDHDQQSETERRIEDAVFSIMATTDIPNIKVGDVVRKAGVSRSTFYRHFDSVEDVVKQFEAGLLDTMRTINKTALKAQFDKSELGPTMAMVSRMEVLRNNREKVIALNSDHGDPVFQHRATMLMHEYFRIRLKDVSGSEVDRDLYLSFVIAGHNNMIEYWLEKRPDIPPEKVAAMLNRLYYSPLFINDESVTEHPYDPFGEK